MKLLESNGIGRPRLDREKGVVFGVKVLGPKSAHGYSYTAAAMRGAVKLYEGKPINIDHPADRKNLGASRSYRDRFGFLRNVRYVEGRGLFSDLHYNRGHQVARQFEWDVEHMPNNLGLSHNATGRASSGGDFVESIEMVRSVDLVADPATNIGLFEARGVGADMPPAPRTVAQVAGDAAYGIVANAELDVATKRKLVLGLLNLFGDMLEAGGGDIEEESDEEPAPDALGIGPKTKGGLAESRLLDLLDDPSRRRLLEQRREEPPKPQLARLRSLLR